MMRAALVLALAAVASAAVAPLSLTTSARPATFTDIDGVYTSAYTFNNDKSSGCPRTVGMTGISTDAKHIGRVPVGNIVQDGAKCSGSDFLNVVSEGTVNQAGLLTAIGFPEAETALKTNANARGTLANTKDTRSMLVGFDTAARTCGKSSYPADTFYFIVKEEVGFSISVKGAEGSSSTVKIPPNQVGLFITTADGMLCLLTNQDTGGGKATTITTTTKDGVETTVDASEAEASPATPPATASSGTIGAVALPGASAANATDSTTDTAASTTDAPSAVSVGGATPSSDGSSEAEPSSEAVIGEVMSVDEMPGVSDEATTLGANGEDEDEGSACFPASATVKLESGKVVTMDMLNVGDRVLTATGLYSDVIMFTHREISSHNKFVKLSTASASLTLSATHYVPVNSGALVSAGSIQVGDALTLASGSDTLETVTSIENVSALGLYNPQTVSGSIVVNNVVTSTYTTAVHPTLAHNVLLAPVRWAYASGLVSPHALGSLFNSGSALASLLPSGPASFLQA